jgi:hypothetical protein
MEDLCDRSASRAARASARLARGRSGLESGNHAPGSELAICHVPPLSGVGEIFRFFRPDRVIVQGDTTTTFAAALAALYHRIQVAHIKAGLRTDNICAPWPEEVNHRLVSHIVDLHFAPTARARDNLLHEGIAGERVVVTGNTGIDALLWVSDQLDRRAELRLRADATSSSPIPAASKKKLRHSARRCWLRARRPNDRRLWSSVWPSSSEPTGRSCSMRCSHCSMIREPMRA